MGQGDVLSGMSAGLSLNLTWGKVATGGSDGQYHSQQGDGEFSRSPGRKKRVSTTSATKPDAMVYLPGE